MRKAFLCLILIAAVLACSFADGISSDLGKTMKNFTFRTLDGGKFSLSEQLKTHDFVFVNNWATWCGWCEIEFPALQEVADKYADRAAVIAVSCDPNDSDEEMLAFAQENNLHLLMARDDKGIFKKYTSGGVPVSFVIDRFGKMAWISAGSIPSADLFERIFNYFLRENYPSTKILEDYRTLGMEKIKRPSSAELSKAANMKGSNIVFRNDGDTSLLPFNTFTENGRTGLVSTNAPFATTVSTVLADINVPVGGVLTFDYEINNADGQAMTFFELSVDGNPVKRFGSARPWSTYAISLTQGSHEIAFSYYNSRSYDGDCWARISNVGIRSGYNGKQALSKIPATPVADDFGISFLSGNIEKIKFNSDYSILDEVFGPDMDYIIINSDSVDARITITEAMDPDMVFTLATFDMPVSLSELKTDDKGYLLTLETEDGLGAFVAYSSSQVYVTDSSVGYVYFADRETAQTLFDAIRHFDPDFDWEIVPFAQSEGNGPETGTLESEYTYKVRFIDQYGAPVSGVAVNFCSDTTCKPVFSSSDGYAVYKGQPYRYHMQVIKVPKGYSFDKNAEYYTELTGGEYTLTVTKN